MDTTTDTTTDTTMDHEASRQHRFPGAARVLASATSLLAAAASPSHAARDVVQAAANPSSPRAGDRAMVVADFLLKDGTWVSGPLLRIDGESVVIDGTQASVARTIARSAVVGGTVSTSMSERGIAPWVDARNHGPFLELNQGDGLPGEPKAAKDQLVWVHPWIGNLQLATESIARLRLEWDGEATRSADADSVLLKNGDAMGGFVETLGTEVVIAPVNPTTDGGSRSIPLDRVAAIAFAAVGEPREPAPTMWFEDGTMLRVGSVGFETAHGWTYAILDAGLAASRADVLARAAASSESRTPPEPVELVLDRPAFSSLASLGSPVVSPPKNSFRYDTSRAVRIEQANRAPLGIARIAIDGPCEASFGGAKHQPRGNPVFSCEVVRPHGSTGGSRVSVRILLDGVASEPVVLDASVSRANIRIEGQPRGAGSVTIEVGDGGDGIVGDAVVLERALVVWSAVP